MTDAGWLSGEDPRRLMSEVWRRCAREDRKLRLYAVACCRRIGHLIPDGPCKLALETSARYAEGAVTRDELAGAAVAGWNAPRRAGGGGPDVSALAESAALLAATPPGSEGITHTPDAVRRLVRAAGGDVEEEARVQCALLRDVFGNLPRPVKLPRRWRTRDVTALARAIYEEGRFEEMPVLADALADAGCDNEEVLGHLRGKGPHVRGCWALDLILGKR